MVDSKVRIRPAPTSLAQAVAVVAVLVTAVRVFLHATGMAAGPGWVEATCEIVDARVVEHRGEDGATWAAHVTYRYHQGGRTYTSDRVRVEAPVPTPDRASVARRVEDHPPGTRLPCWVDPASPSTAVLERGPGSGFARIAWFPASFLAVGLVGLVWVFAPTQRGASARMAPVWGRATSPSDPVSSMTGGVTPLRPRGNRWGPPVGIGVSILLGGPVALAMARAAEDRVGQVVAGLFVAIGVALAFGLLPYHIGKALNPRAEIVVSSGDLVPGGSFDLLWRLAGRSDRVQRLVVKLVGVEVATARRGRRAKTEVRVFASHVLADVTGAEVASGMVRGRVPEGTMHTFMGRNNRVLWSIEVEGTIARWPDIADSYEIVVGTGRRS